MRKINSAQSKKSLKMKSFQFASKKLSFDLYLATNLTRVQVSVLNITLYTLLLNN